jgi:acid phosphatase (class A)
MDAQDMPDSVALLPPPPAEGSHAFHADLEASELRRLRGSPRWEQAARDAGLGFPEAAGIFECALGVPVSETATPHLYRLLRRTRTDAAVVSDPAKEKYARTRPFVANGEPTCTPDKEEGLARNGSYPSGHTSIGWAWALILSEVAPARSDPILARGRSYGESRVVCNVHWRSDVAEGRTMGAAVVARLHGNAGFRADVAAARREVEALAAQGASPSRDCAAEASALAM